MKRLYLMSILALQLLLQQTASAQVNKIDLFGKEGKYKGFSSIAMSPDGGQIAISVDRFLYLIDTKTKQVVRKIPDTFNSLKFSKDGQKIFGINRSKRQRQLLDAKSLETITTNNAQPVPGKIGLVLAKDGASLVIRQFVPGGPIQKSNGIEIGDELVGVGDGRAGPIHKMLSVFSATQAMAGPAGTWIRLQTRKRNSVELQEHLIQRQPALVQGNLMVFQPPRPAPSANSIQHYFQDKRIEICSIDDGSIVNTFAPIDVEVAGVRIGKEYGKCAINSDETQIAILSSKHNRQGNAVEVFDVSKGERIAYAAFIPATTSAIEFSEDGNSVYAAGPDTLEVINLKKQTTVARLHVRENYRESYNTLTGVVPEFASRLVTLKDGLVATGNRFGKIQIWNINRGELIKTITHDKDAGILSICRSRDREMLGWYAKGVIYWATAEDLGKKKISGFEKSDAEPESSLSDWNQGSSFGLAKLTQTIMTGPATKEKQRSTTPFLQFSKDGQRLFVGGETGFIPNEPVENDMGPRVQYLSRLKSRLERLDQPTQYKMGGEFRASNRFHGNISNTVDVYETKSGTWLQGFRCVLRNRLVKCLDAAISPDGKSLAVVGGSHNSQNIVQVFGIHDKQKTKSGVEHRNVGGVAYLNDSQRLLAFFPDKNEISMIDVGTGGAIPDSKISVSKNKFRQQFGLAISPNGETFTLGALRFSSKTGELENSFSGKRCYLFDALNDGATLSCREYHNVQPVIGEGDGVTPIGGKRDIENRVFDAKFSSDGEMFAVASGTNIEIWDRQPLELITTIENAHVRRINSVAFSPSTTTPLLASNSQDGSTRIWNIAKVREKAVNSK